MSVTVGWDLKCRSTFREECGAGHLCSRERDPNKPGHEGALHKCQCGIKWDDNGVER